MHDFHCKAHGFFEAYVPLQTGTFRAGEVPPTPPAKCPTCGADSKKVMLRAPTIGKIAGGTFVVDFPGGHVLTRDDVEERIQRKPDVPFADDPGFAGRIVDRAIERAHRRAQGEIPPRPEPTEAEVKLMRKELAKQGIE